MSDRTNPESYRLDEELISEAFNLRPEERKAFLEERCAAEPGRAEALHRAIESVEKETSSEADDPWVALEGLTIGEYSLKNRISEARGAVFYAEPARREIGPVAFKVVPAEFRGDDFQSWFARERDAHTRSRHPNIAALVDSGTIPAGFPRAGDKYLVVEYIDGDPIDQHCRNRDVDLEGRLRMFLDLCKAVEECHQKGIGHRDIKPSNVLVERTTGSVKLLDFGIAMLRPTQKNDVDATPTAVTQVWERPGSLGHASPEQMTKDSDQLDLRTDIFSLGILLFGLLTDRHPFCVYGASDNEVRKAMTTGTPLSLAQAIRTKESGHYPFRQWGSSPSENFSHAVKARELTPDLDRIVQLALETDREDRYGAVGRLAENIRRFLKNEPIVDYRTSTLYRLSKLVRRHKAATAIASTVVLALGAVAAIQYRANIDLRAERARVERLAGAFSTVLGASEPGYAEVGMVSVRELLKKGQEQARTLDDSPLEKARFLTRVGELYADYGIYGEATKCTREGLSIREDLLGPNDPAVGESRALLGSIVASSGHYREAFDELEQAIEIYRTQDDPLLREEALARVRLGDVLLKTKNADSARTEYNLARETLALLGDPEEALAVHGLGKVEGFAGHPISALELFREAEQITSASAGSNSERLAALLNDTGLMSAKLEAYAEATMRFDKALEIRRRLYGGDHPSVATTMGNIALMAYQQGDSERAEQVSEEALQILDAIPGPPHPMGITLRMNRAAVKYRQGDLDAAEDLFRAAVGEYEASNQSSSIEAAMAWSNLGSVLLRKRDFEGAIQAMEKSVRIRESIFGRDTVATTDGINGLVAVLINQKKYEEAEPLAREVLQTRQDHLPRGASAIGGAYRNLCFCLFKAGREVDALPQLKGWRENLAESDTAKPEETALVACLIGHLEEAPDADSSCEAAGKAVNRWLPQIADSSQ